MTDDCAGKGKRTNLRIEKIETLLLLRAYQVHPGLYEEILNTIKGNSFLLPKAVRELYANESQKKLIQRMREKMQRLLASDNVKDSEIKQELKLIQETEVSHVVATSTVSTSTAQKHASESPVASTSAKKPPAKPDPSESSGSEEDARFKWAREMAKRIEKEPSKKTGKKRPFRELIRDNEEMKNKMLRHYLKKKREESSSSESE